MNVWFFQIQDAFATEPLIPAVDEIVIPSETEAVEDKIEDNLIEQAESQTHLVTEGKNSIFWLLNPLHQVLFLFCWKIHIYYSNLDQKSGVILTSSEPDIFRMLFAIKRDWSR